MGTEETRPDPTTQKSQQRQPEIPRQGSQEEEEGGAELRPVI